MSENTPGPWHVEDGNRIIYVDYVSEKGEEYTLYICEIDPDAQLLFNNSEALANARLIAAAPGQAAEIERLEAENAALLEVCEELLRVGTDGEWWLMPVIDMAREAIAKGMT